MRRLLPGGAAGSRGGRAHRFQGKSLPLQQRGAGNNDTNVRIPVLLPVTTDAGGPCHLPLWGKTGRPRQQQPTAAQGGEIGHSKLRCADGGVAPIPAITPECGAVKRKKGPPVIGVLPASRGRLLGWWAGRWLSRPGNAIDLVRLTVGRGSWATIGWRWRAAHPSWRSSHPAAGVACSFLGVELVSHVVAGASAPASRCVMMARFYPVAPHMRPHRSHRRRCR
jgi:hypothetical protein